MGPTAKTRGGLLLTAVLLAIGGCGGDSEQARTTTQTRTVAPEIEGTNVARIPGKAPSDVASAAVLAVYPDEEQQPLGLVLTPQDDWRQAIVAAQFAADPLRGAILPTAGNYLPPGPSDLVSRLDPDGFPRADGVQALVLGKAGDDVLAALQDRGIHLTQLQAESAPQLAAKSVPFRGGWAHAYSDEVLIVSSEARDYALPAAAWSAYSGDTVAFVNRDRVPEATRNILVQRRKLRLQTPTIYLIGPSDVIPDAVAAQLAQLGTVKRVAGSTPAATAVALARYKDPKTGFGWGLRQGPGNVTLMNVHDWRNAFAALTMASAGPQAPLLLTPNSRSLPSEVVRFLRGLRGGTPSQGFVLGDPQSIGREELKQLDRLLSSGPPSS